MIPLSDFNPRHQFPFVSVGIIATCVLVFLHQISLGEMAEPFIVKYGLVPYELWSDGLDNNIYSGTTKAGPEWVTLFTSMFLHGGFMHLAGNMLYLWVFGDNIENAMGRVKFVAFYLLCGLAAAFAQIATDPASTIPMIGASGAISGVLGAYLRLYPTARVHVLVPNFGVTAMPAMAVLGLWFGIQFLQGLMADSSQGGVAFWAHIGGFVAGFLLVHFFRTHETPPGIITRKLPWDR